MTSELLSSDSDTDPLTVAHLMPSARLSSLFRLDSTALGVSRRTEAGLQAQRQKLLAAVVHAVAAAGYADTSVADVVGLARVSRRTFYEHFAGKQECFLAAYQAYSDALLADMADTVATQTEWSARLRLGIEAYVAGIFTDTSASRVFHLDIYAAGPAAFLLRRTTHVAWAKMIQDEINSARSGAPELAEMVRGLAGYQAQAIVGGVVDAIQSMFEPGAAIDPLLLRRVAIELTVGQLLNATQSVVDALF